MILRNLDIEEYHKHSAVSNSKAGTMLDGGPRMFWLKYDAPESERLIEPRTDALILGQAFEDFLFESSDYFGKRYALKPPITDTDKRGDGRAKEGKEWAKAFPGLIHIKDKDYTWMQGCKANIQADPDIMALLGEGETQVSLRFKSEKYYNLELQSRPDWLNFKGHALTGGRPYSIDLKTTLDFGKWFDPLDTQNPVSGRPIVQFGYHRQAAICRYLCLQEPELRETVQLLLIAEKKAPYRVALILMDEAYLELGMMDFALALKLIAACRKAKEYPLLGQHTGIVKLQPPLWLEQRAGRIFDQHEE